MVVFYGYSLFEEKTAGMDLGKRGGGGELGGIERGNMYYVRECILKNTNK